MADPVPDPSAQSDPTSGGGEEAFAYLQTTHIPQIVVRLIEMQGLAMDARDMRLRTGLGEIIDGLLTDVNAVAVKYALVADGWIVAKIRETQSRNRPHTAEMETHVKSEPGALGMVRVALISELEKIINPEGWGPFWRAQEYGTGQDGVPSQQGRPLFGTFEPSETPPDAAERGLGQGHDLAFIPMGSAPGFGRISVDLPGRHFLRDGATEAGTRYIEAMNLVQQKWMARIRDLMDRVAHERGGGRTYRGTIRA